MQCASGGRLQDFHGQEVGPSQQLQVGAEVAPSRRRLALRCRGNAMALENITHRLVANAMSERLSARSSFLTSRVILSPVPLAAPSLAVPDEVTSVTLYLRTVYHRARHGLVADEGAEGVSTLLSRGNLPDQAHRRLTTYTPTE